MHSVGIDLHRIRSHIAVIDEEGEQLWSRRIGNDPQDGVGEAVLGATLASGSRKPGAAAIRRAVLPTDRSAVDHHEVAQRSRAPP
jgi:predicted NBD/HSP70 family sugar kinase